MLRAKCNALLLAQTFTLSVTSNMKIFDHPETIDDIKKKKDLRFLPGKFGNKKYENCFLILNPFYKQNGDINYKDCSNVKEVLDNFEIFSFEDFMNNSKITDIRKVIYCHHIFYPITNVYSKIEKELWKKYKITLEKNKIFPPIDTTPNEILFFNLINALEKLNFKSFTLDIILDNNKRKVSILELKDYLLNEYTLGPFEIISENQKIVICQEFDLFSTQIYSNDKNLINQIILLSDLEGFFANKYTNLLWDRINIDENEEIIQISDIEEQQII